MSPEEAVQTTLAAEHAAVYVLGALNGLVSVGEAAETAGRLRSAYDAHRGRRDQLRSLLAQRGVTPVGAALAYDVDLPGRDPDRLLAAARAVEKRSALVYAQMVGATAETDRVWAVEALVDSAVRLLNLGGAPTHLPGTPVTS